MPASSPKTSIFDIHLILEPIVSSLSAKDIEHCRQVCRNWLVLFTPYRRTSAMKWKYPLTIFQQDRLLLQGAHLWTANVPMDEPSFDKLIYDPEGRFCSNLSELTCLGRGTYSDQIDKILFHTTRYGPEMRPDSRFFKYNLPNKVQRLLETSRRLKSLSIHYEHLNYNGFRDKYFQSHEQFSVGMLQALSGHRALTSIILNYPNSVDWHGLYAVMNFLPDVIEVFKVSGSYEITQNLLSPNNISSDKDDAVITTVTQRKEPYTRLRCFQWTFSIISTERVASLVSFLKLCPNLQDLEWTGHPLFDYERQIADTLLEFCPQIRHLDLSSWWSLEQMRLIRQYALKKLKVRDWILREDANEIDTEYYRGARSILPSPSLSQVKTHKAIPCLVNSNDTLQVLELIGTGCWTPYHDLDAILLQFPNLQELEMDWFDFDTDPSHCSDQESIQGRKGTITTIDNNKTLQKLKLQIFSQHSREENEEAAARMAMRPPQPPPSLENNDYFDDPADTWSTYDDDDETYAHPVTSGLLPSELDLSVPYSPVVYQSSVTLAPNIARLYDRLTHLQSLKEFQVYWMLVAYPDEEIVITGDIPRLDVRGPLLEVLLTEQGFDRGALEKLNLLWTENHPRAFGNEVDLKLKSRGFVLTFKENMSCGSIFDRRFFAHDPSLERFLRSRRILTARAEALARIEQEEWEREEAERNGFDRDYALYKSRGGRHRILKERTKSTASCKDKVKSEKKNDTATASMRRLAQKKFE